MLLCKENIKKLDTDSHGLVLSEAQPSRRIYTDIFATEEGGGVVIDNSLMANQKRETASADSTAFVGANRKSLSSIP